MTFDSRSHSDEIAKSCLEAAAAAYDAAPPGFVCHRARGGKVCIRLELDVVTVAFRGTQNLENLRTDLQIRQVPCDAGHVHQGFFEAFQALKEALTQSLQHHGGKIIRFVGHSLGGALATLAAWHFAGAGYVVECVTFGCPKVGDEDFCRSYRQRVPKTSRFINKFDPIPRLLHGAETTLRAVKDDADILHMILGKIVKFPQEQLVRGQYAHVCDAITLDAGPTSSVNHWGSAISSLVCLTGGSSDEKKMNVWCQALVPHDVAVYKQNLEKKPSIQLGSKDLRCLLAIIRASSSSPVMVTAAVATGLAILVWWRSQARSAPSELHDLEQEFQSVAQKRAVQVQDLPQCCEELRAKLESEMGHANTQELGQQLDVLCQATLAVAQGEDKDILEQWRHLAPLLGRFFWMHATEPGQWMELVPSSHFFQDFALDEAIGSITDVAALAWAPDSWEARVSLAFTEVLVQKDRLPVAATVWFERYAQLDPDSPSCLEALHCDSPDPAVRQTALKILVDFLPHFVIHGPCTLLLAIWQRIQHLTMDAHREVKTSAKEHLKQVNDLLSLEPLLYCTQHQDSNVRRDARQLLKDLWDSDDGPGWILQELERLDGDASHTATEVWSFLLEAENPELRAPPEVEVIASRETEISQGSPRSDSSWSVIN